MPINKSTARCHNHLIGKLAADCHPCPTDRTDQIAATRKFSDVELLAKTQISELLATRTVKHSNRHITAYRHLTEGQGTVNF